LRHPGEVAEGHVMEAALLVEASFLEDPVPVWVVAAEVSRALVGNQAPAEQGLTSGPRVELAHQASDEAAGLSEQVGMKAEGGSQDEHAVRQAQQQAAAQVFGEQQNPLL
jgi:hypothetical protein